MGGFAYRVPSNPDQPELGYATLVRAERVRVGDRIEYAVSKREDGVLTVGAEDGVWEVVAVLSRDDDGRPFHSHRIGAAEAIRAGELVLRRVAAGG